MDSLSPLTATPLLLAVNGRYADAAVPSLAKTGGMVAWVSTPGALEAPAKAAVMAALSAAVSPELRWNTRKPGSDWVLLNSAAMLPALVDSALAGRYEEFSFFWTSESLPW